MLAKIFPWQTQLKACSARTDSLASLAVSGAALYSNTTGENNTANGYQALYSNTTGNINTATGYQALMSNTTGGNNTAGWRFGALK